jgi:1-acyl-sn-glycerol-3-phosphate acyltransferase
MHSRTPTLGRIVSSETTKAGAFAATWRRRAVTIPLMLAATGVAVFTLPLVLPCVAMWDVLRRRRQLPTVRVVLFLIQYGLNDSVEIVLAPFLWVMAGFGTRLRSDASQRRHERLMAWSVRLLARRAEQLLGLRFTIDDASLPALAPGPVTVLCRHVSIVDSSLPSLLYQRLGFRTRGVVMAELLADPGFDLLYPRTGSVFIERDNGPDAQAAIAGFATPDSMTATVIFPEGQLFRPDKLARSLSRLATRDPVRAAVLAGLRHVLPPRPGGFFVLLDTMPTNDVVVIAHVGLDPYPTFAQLARAVPLLNPVRVVAWRTPAAEIPPDLAGRTGWLDQQWLRMDEWIATDPNNESVV